MKKYEIIKISEMWSTNTLKRNVETLINEKSNDGYEIITVAFGVNLWWMPTAFITFCK
jgi:hypothetical protein